MAHEIRVDRLEDTDRQQGKTRTNKRHGAWKYRKKPCHHTHNVEIKDHRATSDTSDDIRPVPFAKLQVVIQDREPKYSVTTRHTKHKT
mmetsp:Transcript_944/g.2361  ORF Transcript_944/g.2361 Transcript_944/m.2361 type:complete len:88 (-) Transcript_944:867-1130(-)